LLADTKLAAASARQVKRLHQETGAVMRRAILLLLLVTGVLAVGVYFGYRRGFEAGQKATSVGIVKRFDDRGLVFSWQGECEDEISKQRGQVPVEHISCRYRSPYGSERWTVEEWRERPDCQITCGQEKQ
jgi:hypothetical protein